MDQSTGRTPVSEHACTECRRRKAKCDKTDPCSNCAKYQRTCSYARQPRTPLTRRHLSEVEKELARTKELLRSTSHNGSMSAVGPYDGLADVRRPVSPPSAFDIASQTTSHPGPARNAMDRAYSSAERDGNERIEQFARPAVASAAVTMTKPGPNNRVISSDPLLSGASSTEPHPLMAPEIVGSAHPQRNGPKGGPAFSFETPPASGDFDWDERLTRNQSKFVDGMASLSSSRAGYLGVASGAALLRLADSNTSDDSAIGIDTTNHDDTATPTPRALFSFSQLEPFVEAYFQLYHISYPILHEATFRAQFMEVIPRPRNSAWQVLLHIVSAVGAFTASESPSEVDVALFEAAKARLTIDMLETGNLTLVQALTLISNYVQKRNQPNSGYNYCGLAKRVAMGIGLHKEFASWHAKPLMLEMRRRAWWCLYVFDVGATITFSRPLDLPESGIEVSLPLNVHDSDITASTRESPPEAQETTLYSHVRAQSQFHLATNPIYARIIATPFPDSQELLTLEDQRIVQYRANLPQWFQEDTYQLPKYRLCHAILMWREQNFRILMYRTFLLRHIVLRARTTGQITNGNESHYDQVAVDRCLDAAGKTVDLITNFWSQEKRTVMACWYSLYFLFQAILIPVICLRNQPQSPKAAGWKDQIFRAAEAIADMSRLNSAAARCHTVIMALCAHYFGQNQADWTTPSATQESPQTQLNGLYPFMWPMMDMNQTGGAFDAMMQESTMQDFMTQITGF